MWWRAARGKVGVVGAHLVDFVDAVWIGVDERAYDIGGRRAPRGHVERELPGLKGVRVRDIASRSAPASGPSPADERTTVCQLAAVGCISTSRRITASESVAPTAAWRGSLPPCAHNRGARRGVEVGG